MKAVLIPGDGIGREIAESVREVSAALNTGIEWQEFAAGAEYAAESGELIAPGTLDAIEACGWALKGPTATPIGKGFRSINVQLRQRFSTYANLRPVHTLPGVPTRFDNVDLVIVRENTEDLYKGIEYMLNDEIANGVKLITRPACEKICRFAFDYARKNGRKKVTAVHKANPSAILMSFAMMLNDLGETDKAAKLNAAILAQVEEGKVVTADIGGTAGTKEFTQAVIARL